MDWHNKSERGQAVDLDVGEEMQDYRLHFRVHHDRSYPQQSWAHVDVWSSRTLQWNRVADLLALEIVEPYEAADELRARAAALLLGERR